MRYRALDANGDFTFGRGPANFLVNTPQTVAQAVLTRLRLFVGEWFLDVTEGLDRDRIVGMGTESTRDAEIQTRVLDTPGVKSITAYMSVLNPSTRQFTVALSLDTVYGATTVTYQT